MKNVSCPKRVEISRSLRAHDARSTVNTQLLKAAGVYVYKFFSE